MSRINFPYLEFEQIVFLLEEINFYNSMSGEPFMCFRLSNKHSILEEKQ